MSTASHIAVSDLIAAIEARYPPHTAESWDRVGLVVGDPGPAVTRVLLAELTATVAARLSAAAGGAGDDFLDAVTAAAALRADLAAGSDAPWQIIVSDLVTDVWTAHAAMSPHADKGARP